METKTPKRKAGWYYNIPETAEGYPSVTTILRVLAKPQLDKWRINKAILKYIETEDIELARSAPYMAMREAGDEGSVAHNIIDEYWKGKPYDKSLGGKVGDYLRGFEMFLNDHQGLTLVMSEGTCYSHSEKYAGTFDGLFEYNGEIWLIDWKTSNYVVDEHKIQLIAYSEALKEMGQKVDRCTIVQLKNDGTYDLYNVVRNGTNTVGEPVDRYEAFKCAKYLYHTKMFNEGR